MKRFALVLSIVIVGCTSDAPPCDDCLVLYDVTVIDGLGNGPAEHQVIIIRKGVIADIVDVRVYGEPPENQRIDAAGLYVMPGLIDMHAHVTILPMDKAGALISQMDPEASGQVLRTLLDFGITTIRNPAAPASNGVELRDAVASGIIEGPEILAAADALNRASADFGPFVATPTVDAVRAEVGRQALLGVDYIKVYGSLSPDLIQAAVEEAHVHGLEVIGHLQRTTWTQAAQLGIDHITHGAPWSAEYLPEAARSGYRGTIKERMTWLEQVDFSGPAIREMIQVMADSGVTVDPTLTTYRVKFHGNDPYYLNNPDSIYAPQLIRDIWRRGTFTDDWTPEDYTRGHTVWPRVLELTKAMYDGGVLLTAGSDLPNPWVVPGASLHEELKLLYDAGIPAVEVLRIATHNGAVALGLEDRIGSIQDGMEADLIVLRANPIADLANTRAIEWVILNGEIRY